MNFKIYQGYAGYGAITVAELTTLIRQISRSAFSPGTHSVRYPTAATVESREEAQGLIDIFRMRAEEMGWSITQARIVEGKYDGFYTEISFMVPGPEPAVFYPPGVAPPKEGPSIGATVLVGGIGLTALGLLVYAGTRKKR